MKGIGAKDSNPLDIEKGFGLNMHSGTPHVLRE